LLQEIAFVAKQAHIFSRRGMNKTYWHTRLAQLNGALEKFNQSLEEEEKEHDMEME
jgi:hypothetical protein